LDCSTAGALALARSSDPFRGRLKKTANLRQGYGRQASCVLGLLALLTYCVYAPRAQSPAALLDGLFQPSPFSLNSPTIRLKRSKHLTQTSTLSQRSLISDRLLGTPDKIKKFHHHRGDHDFLYFTMHANISHVFFTTNCRF